MSHYSSLYDLSRSSSSSIRGLHDPRSGAAMFLCCNGEDAEEPTFVTSVPMSFSIEKFEEVVEVEAVPVIPTVRQPEPPTCATFTVVIPTKGFSTLGVQIDLIEKHPPMVTRIEEGAIQNFNNVHSNSMIRPFDVLMAVNGVQSWEAMEKKINDLHDVPDQLFVTLNRPRRVHVVLEKAGTMGLTLAFTEVSIGVLVRDLHSSGLIADWNGKHTSDAVSIGDRILELNGTPYAGSQLAQLLEKASRTSSIRLTVLKYSQADDLMLDGLMRGSFV